MAVAKKSSRKSAGVAPDHAAGAAKVAKSSPIKLPASFPAAARKVSRVPLNFVSGNSANFRDVIPNLATQGYTLFPVEEPAKKGKAKEAAATQEGSEAGSAANKHVLWHMLVGKPGQSAVKEEQAEAVRMIEEFEPELADMAGSMEALIAKKDRSNGLLEPVHMVVFEKHLEVESGMARCVAMAMVHAKKGETQGEIDAFVDKESSLAAMECRAGITNIFRFSVDNIAKARLIGRLHKHEMSTGEIATQLHMTAETVRNYLELDKCSDDIKSRVKAGKITMTEARDIAKEARRKDKPIDEIAAASGLMDTSDEDGDESESGGKRKRSRFNADGTPKPRLLKVDKVLKLLYDEDNQHTIEILCIVLQISMEDGNRMRSQYIAEQAAAALDQDEEANEPELATASIASDKKTTKKKAAKKTAKKKAKK